ncbi:MAG: DEAD/DEAH box helicase, partial [Akkermansiaceae bacterium]|nr:DEAD/DEAH box helicase [Akkermansiaceae bacterium]
VLEGKDVIGAAQTGTGKTAAFALPTISKLGSHQGTRCLILEPTRELAAQVYDSFQDYGKGTDLTYALIHGGVGYGAQNEALEQGADVVVATPGRLLDHMS